MRLTIGSLAERIAVVGGKSRKRIYSKASGKWEPIADEENTTKTKINDAGSEPPVEKRVEGGDTPKKETGIDYRENEMEIQMLSAPLYEQVFRNTVPRVCKPDAINR